MKKIEEKRAADLEEQKYSARREGELQDKKDFEDYKNRPEAREAERKEMQKDELAKGQVKNVLSAEDAHSQAQGILEEGKDILSEFSDITKDEGWAYYQIKKNFNMTDVSKVQLRIKKLVFAMVKAEQGSRPSDFDVKTMMDGS